MHLITKSILLLVIILTCSVSSASSRYIAKYGVETTINFDAYEIDGVDLRVDWVPAAADCEVMKDEGASTQCTNTATDEGSTYSIVLTATEMQAARIVLKVVDAATKVLLDKVVIIETYGNASAEHAFDLDTASVAQSADNETRLATIETDTNSLNDTKIPQTLNLTASGNIGVDWANVENPTTALVLSGTTIGTSTVNTDMVTVGAIDTELTGTHGAGAWTTGAGGTGLSALAEGTAQSGTASTIVLASASTFADNELNGNVINIHTGTGVGQSRVITSNTLSDDTCNISPNWATNPSSDSQYEIVQGSTNISLVSLDGTAADNLELDYDGTGYDKSNSAIGTSTANALASVCTEGRLAELDAANLPTTTDDTLTDTAQIGVAGAGLSNINLPNQTMDIVGDITGNLSGSVGSVTGAVGSVTGAVGSVAGNVDGSIGSLGATAKTDVNTEVDTALNTAIPGTPTTGSINDALNNQNEIILAGAASGTHSTTTMQTDLTVTVNDQYNGRIITFTSDTATVALRNQQTDITDTVTTNSELTFTALTTTPQDGDKFVIN